MCAESARAWARELVEAIGTTWWKELTPLLDVFSTSEAFLGPKALPSINKTDGGFWMHSFTSLTRGRTCRAENIRRTTFWEMSRAKRRTVSSRIEGESERELCKKHTESLRRTVISQLWAPRQSMLAPLESDILPSQYKRLVQSLWVRREV